MPDVHPNEGGQLPEDVLVPAARHGWHRRPRVSPLRLAVLVLVSAFVLGSCGTTTAPDGDAPDGDAPGGGEALEQGDIDAAVEALEEQGSWTFEATVLAASAGSDMSITGTERREPERAVAAQHSNANGDFQYVRIGDDIWFDAATGEWTQIEAGEAANLISQYEPLHLAGLVELAGRMPGQEFEFVAEEDANGVASRHYRLSEDDREDLAAPLGLEPDDWAADVWTATDGGYLVRYVWGPQSFDTAEGTGVLGFTYDAADVGCSCPIDPPT